MSLSSDLLAVSMSFACPRCGHVINRLGSWCKAKRNIRCEECGEDIALTYRTKMDLFAHYSIG